MMMRHNPCHHTVLTYTSFNDGKDWVRSNIIDLGGKGDHSGVTESCIVQLKDGRLWQLIRTN
ncbi:sialidase family protein [Niabella beijingensis]|uniref:sialidase family protein n=1 Tax=Niabella beijingensis TaxID=2872700 RepID=UPI001CBA7C63|nr:sialidase family protein [Niabella beijingensis]MBZ4191387.1 glycoside hydrolase [Niabella beijingensis]